MYKSFFAALFALVAAASCGNPSEGPLLDPAAGTLDEALDEPTDGLSNE